MALSSTERVRALRQRRRREGTRVDAYIGDKASWRLTALAKAWRCSRGDVLDRLLIEADERYEDVLFPEA